MKTNNIEDKIFKVEDFKKWQERWNKRLKINNTPEGKYFDLMRSTNPIIIPRNHKVEEALKAANENNFEHFHNLLKVLKSPYKSNADLSEYQKPAPQTDEKYQTFCGT
jgi:uncharacterized protein YdiU (UPF0061 family)